MNEYIQVLTPSFNLAANTIRERCYVQLHNVYNMLNKIVTFITTRILSMAYTFIIIY